MYVVRPKFAPCTVTLADPVEARFVRVIVLSIGVSKEMISVTDPTCSPTVTTILRVPRIPPIILNVTEVSESHLVASD